jgi:hypothetical protein
VEFGPEGPETERLHLLDQSQSNYVAWTPRRYLLQPGVERIGKMLIPSVEVVQLLGDDVRPRGPVVLPRFEGGVGIQRRLRLE